MSNDDTIKLSTDVTLKDSDGNTIKVNIPQPEYIIESFNLHSKEKTNGDDE